MTPLQALLSLKLGQPVLEYIAAERRAGTPVRTIASQLTERTGVDVSHATVATWTLDTEGSAA